MEEERMIWIESMNDPAPVLDAWTKSKNLAGRHFESCKHGQDEIT